MFAEYFDAGGPVMYVVLVAWIIVLAGVLDRMAYVAGRAWRRPFRDVRTLVSVGQGHVARERVEDERSRARRGLSRIDAVSQIAPSVGLFGTVLGIARSFFARGMELELAAPEVLASGMATALFTTIGGLIVFLFGQAFLIAWSEWETACERRTRALLAEVRKA